MADVNATGLIDPQDAGIYIVGEYLGVKEPGTWTPPGEAKEVAVPPKLGVSDGEREFAIRIGSMADLATIIPGAKKGDRIAVPVRVFPGRNGRGINYVWAGMAGGDGGGRWT